MSGPPDLADRAYRLLLHVYPPEYIETFGEEMYSTFIEGANEARSRGVLGLFVLRELRDAPRVLATAYWNGWKKKLQNGIQILYEVTTVSGLPPAPPDGRTSWMQIAFESSLFLLPGLLLILTTYLPFTGLDSDWQRDVGLLGKIIVPLALPPFLIGLAHGLPRWAYPFGGLLLSYSGLVSIQTSLWLFLFIMLFSTSILALAAIVTDPQPSLLPIPIRRIRQSLSLDWTRLSFAFYGAMPLVVLMAFDDSRYNNRTPYFAFSVLMMIVGALVYCRSREKTIQITALLIGVTFSIWGSWLDKISFSDGLMNWIVVSSQGIAGSLWIFKLWIQWMVLVLSPAFLLVLGRAFRVRRTI